MTPISFAISGHFACSRKVTKIVLHRVILSNYLRSHDFTSFHLETNTVFVLFKIKLRGCGKNVENV